MHARASDRFFARKHHRFEGKTPAGIHETASAVAAHHARPGVAKRTSLPQMIAIERHAHNAVTWKSTRIGIDKGSRSGLRHGLASSRLS